MAQPDIENKADGQIGTDANLVGVFITTSRSDHISSHEPRIAHAVP
jgi:hypothetical protein